jgi:hypothetical protein
VVAVFFPLDRELELPDGQLLPHAQETFVRLSTEVPFARAARHMQAILGITLSRSTARRQTLAAGYVSAIGEAMRACGGQVPAGWLAGVLHRLKHEGPERVLRHLHQLLARFPQAQAHEQMQYLEQRRGQMQYHCYRQDGWPIGSGCVESEHKLVMQAPMKRAVMHWKRSTVNPLLTLRTTLCNDRWEEG